jgi:bifunctional non-homologous end joining protein LigD
MSTLLDGEIVAIDENGRISFNLLQNHRSAAQALLFYAFDVIACRGRSLLRVPLSERRRLLKDLLKPQAPGPIGVSDVFESDPENLITIVREYGFEGIVAKRTNSCYEPGKRNGAWLKYKVHKGQEFVIGGYTGGGPLDALIVGYYDGDQLMYAGKVRNGFVPHVRREVAQQLRELRSDVCPFANLPEKNRTIWALTREEMKNCIWLRPELVAQIEFTEWTPDGHLRHARFISLREDKQPQNVVREDAP